MHAKGDARVTTGHVAKRLPKLATDQWLCRPHKVAREKWRAPHAGYSLGANAPMAQNNLAHPSEDSRREDRGIYYIKSTFAFDNQTKKRLPMKNFGLKVQDIKITLPDGS